MYMARRKMTVLEFASQIGAASVSIPVKVKCDFDVIGKATSLYALQSLVILDYLNGKLLL